MSLLDKAVPLLVASHNEGKIWEIDELLAPFGFTVTSAKAKGLPDPEETGTTFEENAAIKALAAMRATGLPSLSDDSGLAVDALGGDPGIYTARWAGEPRDFRVGMQRVEDALQAAGATAAADRGARFVAVLCLALPDGSTRFWRGEVEGTVVWPPVGTLGFGYDPIFLPEGSSRTFGEMMSAEKHGWTPGQATALSHRARAFARFAADVLGAA